MPGSGRKVVDDVTSKDPVKALLEQGKNAQAQVKAAFTSVRKTADAAVDAGRAQATTATSQVKAAATSVQKTAEAAVDAAKSIAS